MTDHKKQVIGWFEHLDLPSWGIKELRAKVDTGARTSSLDVDHIRYLPSGKVRFGVVLSKKGRARKKIITARVTRIAKVKASPLHQHKRIFVKTKIKLGTVVKTVEINLIDRSNMVYRMLLGRTALKGDFVVDVSHSAILTPREKNKRRQKT